MKGQENTKMIRKTMVRFNDDAIKQDIIGLGISESKVFESLGRADMTLSYARRVGKINAQTIIDFCNKYFPGDCEKWKKYVAKEDYEKVYAFLDKPSDFDKRVSANFENMEEDMCKMNLTASALSRVFDFGSNYFAKAKSDGKISYSFCDKLSNLTGAPIHRYVIIEEKKEDLVVPQKNDVCAEKTLENLEDINAVLVSVLKLMQRLDANMQTLVNELKGDTK
jgi:hypothetical protein